MKAIYRALEDFIAEVDLDAAHILHFNDLAKFWITELSRYLDSKTLIDDATHQLVLQGMQQLWHGH